MSSRLPPLKALRAFEAAGRQNSFRLAAQELGVTPGAVSRQIKSLEDFLKVPLFERGGPDVALTPESKAYLSLVSELFRDLEVAAAILAEPGAVRPLHLASTLTFASYWLIPRLPDLLAQHPGFSLCISLSMMRNTPGVRGPADVTIQSGPAVAQGYRSRKFMRSVLAPVCSPRLVSPRDSIGQVLGSHPLLLSDQTRAAWKPWLEAAGLDETAVRAPPGRIEFPTNALACQAAIAGLGIALADLALMSDDLQAGRLVAPARRHLESGADWHVLYSSDADADQRVRQFCAWLVKSGAASEKIALAAGGSGARSARRK